MNPDIQELLKYCQICGCETKINNNNRFYLCTNFNCENNIHFCCAVSNSDYIYINDGSNHGTFTLFINYYKSKYHILINGNEIYFDSVEDAVKGYLDYKKNKIFT